jgi:teichuronic acid biosynthesis glycosyltransferase TuaC
LRILTVSSLFPNSTDPNHGIFVYQRVAQLAQLADNESKVVAPLPFFPKWLGSKRWGTFAQVPEEEQIGELAVHHPRYFLIPKISMSWQGASEFAGCLACVKTIHRNWKIDCVDAHYVYPDGMAAILLGKYLNVPVIVSARGTDINLLPKFWLVRKMIQWTLAQAAGVIAVSAALKDVMVGLGTDLEKIAVVPNGVDPARFQPIPMGDARQHLGLPLDGLILVSVGTLIPSKGHELIIRALSQRENREQKWLLYILGGGPRLAHLERVADELGLRERIHFVGKRPNQELQFWFSAASLSCLTSSREGWPNVLTESLACGTPVVATRVGGIPEIVHSEALGILVEQTVDSVADGLRRAMSKNWDREGISLQARARTWQTVAKELDDIFKARISTFHSKRSK